MHGPLLASLGASAVVVGLVTGAGEAASLLLRLVSGPLADRTRRYWTLALIGYALTAVSVPLLALVPQVGAAGLGLAAGLIVAERTGKAIRSPAKSALLAGAARAVGSGRGFGVHKALDQLGAFLGPLLVAGLTALTASVYPALAALAVPGAGAVLLLSWLRRRAAGQDGADRPLGPPEPPTGRATGPATRGAWSLPHPARTLVVSIALSTGGLLTFGLISYRAVTAGTLSTATVPLVYALAMAAEALAALTAGSLYDRVGARVLLVLPPLVVLAPLAALDPRPSVLLAGVCVWGAATGVQDSTVKSLVADLVPAERRGTAFGVVAAVQGVAALAGGAALGGLLDAGRGPLVAAVAASQLLSAAALWRVLGTPT